DENAPYQVTDAVHVPRSPSAAASRATIRDGGHLVGSCSPEQQHGNLGRIVRYLVRQDRSPSVRLRTRSLPLVLPRRCRGAGTRFAMRPGWVRRSGPAWAPLSV